MSVAWTGFAIGVLIAAPQSALALPVFEAEGTTPTGQAESGQAESGQSEPAQTEPAQTEPAQTESATVDATGETRYLERILAGYEVLGLSTAPPRAVVRPPSSHGGADSHGGAEALVLLRVGDRLPGLPQVVVHAVLEDRLEVRPELRGAVEGASSAPAWHAWLGLRRAEDLSAGPVSRVTVFHTKPEGEPPVPRPGPHLSSPDAGVPLLAPMEGVLKHGTSPRHGTSPQHGTEPEAGGEEGSP